MKLRLLVLIASVPMIGSVTGLAQTTTWQGGTSDLPWSNSANWTTGVPGSSTTAYFSSNATSTLDTNFTLLNLIVSGGAFTLNSSGGSLTVNSAVTVTTPGAVVFNTGILGGAGLNLEGGGTLTLNAGGASTFTQGTFLFGSGGTLIDGAANAYSPSSIMYLDTPGVVEVNFNETIASLTDYLGTSHGSVVIATGATLDLAGGYTSTFSGVISGGGNLQKDVTGTLILAGANTYTGATVINGAGARQYRSETAGRPEASQAAACRARAR